MAEGAKAWAGGRGEPRVYTAGIAMLRLDLRAGKGMLTAAAEPRGHKVLRHVQYVRG